jgi:hypothetical protein
MAWYWFVLTAVVCLSLFFLIAKLTSKRTMQIFVFATICVTILAIPFQDPPVSYLTAVAAVLNLSILIGPLFKRDRPSVPANP